MMGLSPADFWSLSPREWRWLMEAFAPEASMRLGDLQSLAALYPDEKK